MGFMGSSMVVDCHIEVGYCHTGGMPMSVHMFCLSSRRASARVSPTASPSSAPIRMVHGLHCGARPWNGSWRAGRKRRSRLCQAKRRPHPSETATCVGSSLTLDPTYIADGVVGGGNLERGYPRIWDVGL
jgi:hypothetical protein